MIHALGGDSKTIPDDKNLLTDEEILCKELLKAKV